MKLVVRGGARLSGEVPISGAKNAALPLIAAAMLADRCVIENVPRLDDVSVMCSLLSHMGASSRFLEPHVLEIDSTSLQKLEAPYDLVKMLRASILVLGPLLARHGWVRVSMPGGCTIGARAVDQHLLGLEALGAKSSFHEGFIELSAPEGLFGAEFTFECVSVTGTENVLMAAVRAQGESVLRNCACEPEVVNLCEALVAMGANIEGIGTSTLKIQGVSSLKGARLRVIPDRIEAASYLIAAAATRGEVLASGADARHLEAVLSLLKEGGAEVAVGAEGVRLRAPGRLSSMSLVTGEYPQFPTDVQAQMCALNATAEGVATIEERIFENRLNHCRELQRLQANIDIKPQHCIIHGRPSLEGAIVEASDLRAAFALVLAGLSAGGETTIESARFLYRGYEDPEGKFKALGAEVYRI